MQSLLLSSARRPILTSLLISAETLECRAGIRPSHVEVRFQNLSVTAMIYLGNRSEPTVLNSYRNFFEVRLLLPHANELL